MVNVQIPSKSTVARLIIIAVLLMMGAVRLLSRTTDSAAQTPDDMHITAEWLPGPDPIGDNVLRNGGLNGDYYWAYPNHYTAPEWGRWWQDGSVLPEFDRTRNSAEPYMEGDRAQRLHKWGSVFVSGIYQVTDVTPCVTYQLDGYIQSHSIEGAHPNTRIGLDPTGTQLTKSQNSGGVSEMPALTNWSAWGTQLWTWDHFTTQAEALGDKMTSIVYAAPQPGPSSQTHYYAIYFDAMSLTKVAFPEGKLPVPATWTPTGYIQKPTTEYTTPTLTIQWTTSDPASTQILYSVTPSIITPTESMTYTTYLPIISQGERLPYLNTHPTTLHEATISGLKTGDVVQFIALSRRVDGTACTTETSFPYEITIGSDQLIQLDPSEAAELYAGN